MSQLVFRSFNGLHQLRLETIEDLAAIHVLEEPRWRATSAPLEQLFCDPKFLAYVDSDNNGRVRVNEVKAAHTWLIAQLADKSGVIARKDTLKLSHLDPKSSEAAGMKSLAERIVRERGGPASDVVSVDVVALAEVRAFRDSYAKRFPNGDGVLVASQIGAESAEVGALLAKVLATTGGADDLSGEKGVRAADLDAFLALAKSFTAWHGEGEAARSIPPFGATTARAAELIVELGPKVDQFFALGDLVALETNAKARLDASAEALAALDLKDTAALEKWAENAPLARPTADRVLDLDGQLNPRFAAKLLAFRDEVVAKAAGARRFTRADWDKLRAIVTPYLDWQKKKPAGLPADVGVAELEVLTKPATVDRLRALIVQDQEASAELKHLNNLEKLVLYQRWFLDLVNNFVSFPHLFIPGERSLFEVGTMVLDGRALSLCVLVTDRAGHRKVAEGSQMFVVYAELTRKDGDKTITREVAAAVTSGTRGGISVGKRGVFYDRDAVEWDARVVDTIVAPISLLEAAIAPFVRLKTFIGQRIEKLTQGKLESLESSTTKATEGRMDKAIAGPPAATATAVAAPAAGAAPAAPPAGAPAAPTAAATATAAPGGAFGTLLVGGGVALAAVGSTLAFVVKTLADIDAMRAIEALIFVAGFIALLSGFLGWLKLRKRDVSTLLEACGWALNGRMFLTRRLSLLYTQVPELPEGSKTERPLITSKYIVAAERRRARRQWKYVFLTLLVASLVAAAFYYELIWEQIQLLMVR